MINTINRSFGDFLSFNHAYHEITTKEHLQLLTTQSAQGFSKYYAY